MTQLECAKKELELAAKLVQNSMKYIIKIMTQLEYSKKELELAAKLVQNSMNEDEEVRKMANELYDLCKKSVGHCLVRPDLFDIDYDNN